MDANDLIGLASKSRFLRAVDVGEGARFTISGVTVESMRGEGGDDKEKGVVWFEEDGRGLVLNVTLTVILRDLFGVDLEGWHGKRITLYNDKSVRRGGQAVGGIRIAGTPDIQKDHVIVAGKNAFSKGTKYVIRAEKDADPLALALERAGLTVDAFDRWASGNQRPPFREMDAQTRRQAAKWISEGGDKAIRRSSAPPAPAPLEDDPLAV